MINLIQTVLSLHNVLQSTKDLKCTTVYQQGLDPQKGLELHRGLGLHSLLSWLEIHHSLPTGSWSPTWIVSQWYDVSPTWIVSQWHDVLVICFCSWTQQPQVVFRLCDFEFYELSYSWTKSRFVSSLLPVIVGSLLPVKDLVLGLTSTERSRTL